MIQKVSPCEFNPEIGLLWVGESDQINMMVGLTRFKFMR